MLLILSEKKVKKIVVVALHIFIRNTSIQFNHCAKLKTIFEEKNLLYLKILTTKFNQTKTAY